MPRSARRAPTLIEQGFNESTDRCRHQLDGVGIERHASGEPQLNLPELSLFQFDYAEAARYLRCQYALSLLAGRDGCADAAYLREGVGLHIRGISWARFSASAFPLPPRRYYSLRLALVPGIALPMRARRQRLRKLAAAIQDESRRKGFPRAPASALDASATIGKSSVSTEGSAPSSELRAVLRPARVRRPDRQGRSLMKTHWSTLQRIEARFGVPAPIFIAIGAGNRLRRQ